MMRQRTQEWTPAGYLLELSGEPRKFRRIPVRLHKIDMEEPGDDGSRAGQHASAPDAEGDANGQASSSSRLSPRARGILAVVGFIAWCVVLDAAVLFMSFKENQP